MIIEGTKDSNENPAGPGFSFDSEGGRDLTTSLRKSFQLEGATKEAAAPGSRAGTAQRTVEGSVQSIPGTAGANLGTVKWQKLTTLKNLFNAGFITKTEYAERKCQVIDELTGTTFNGTRDGSHTQSTRGSTRGGTEGKTTERSKRGRTASDAYAHPEVVPKGPPDFTSIEPERATKHVYDLASRKWKKSAVQVKLDTTPFSKGSIRLVYHLQDTSDNKKGIDNKTTYVAKISMDPRDNANREVYFRDVEMQAIAAFYANQFNEYNPPKKVDFVKAWLLQLDDREGAPICGVERFIDGPYRKHNNNFGFVSDDERNTPQAFSHFTYESSNHGMLVCDIQGVSDMYTDPQVHSQDGQGFGKGNMGQRGIDKFIQTHRCNAICRYLKLPPINANYSGLGTLPVTQFMQYEEVRVVNIGSLAQFPRIDKATTTTAPLLDKQTNDDTLCAFCSIL